MGYPLHWNEELPNETRIGSFGWYGDAESVQKIEGEFRRRQPVRLFTFDSDAELRFEEVLFPL